MTPVRRASLGPAVVRFSTGFALVWLALASVMILWDQVHQLPPRAPTPRERARATPGAEAKWRIVHDQLAQRLTYSPAEFGAVWQSRSGRICGTVTRMNARVFYRERFFTDKQTAYFAADDERLFMRAWLDCVGDHWAPLKIDYDNVGFCAVPRNQHSVIAAVLCRKR